jgi:hypothetical protein
VDDLRQGLRLDDQEEVDLDDRYLEVAELGDHLDLNVVAAEDEEPKVLGLLLPQVQHRPQELVEQHHFAAQELVQVRALEQRQVLLW